jgi:hypothetical protein
MSTKSLRGSALKLKFNYFVRTDGHPFAPPVLQLIQAIRGQPAWGSFGHDNQSSGLIKVVEIKPLLTTTVQDIYYVLILILIPVSYHAGFFDLLSVRPCTVELN